MQKLISVVLLLFLLLSDCSYAQPTEDVPDKTESEEILIVYLSRTKNTEAVANMIQQEVGGKMVSLELENPYPENYQAIVQQVQRENETGYLPPLKTKIDNIDTYNAVFVGFPTWGMRLPPPMKTFLTEYDLSKKTVIPFNTNAGYGLGSSLETIGQLCPECLITEAFSVRGGIERDGILFVMEGERAIQVNDELKSWLRKIGF